MAKIQIFIENKPYVVEEGLTILEAAKICGYNIPNLCTWKKGECSVASCRVCLVKVEGERRLVPSCAYPIREGIRISIVLNFYFLIIITTVKLVEKTDNVNF